uniref:Uncharacterized protein n=1 Tax=Timema poppense TaxID=170557 RepID=A0A7R9CV15_TIMPO|nr:unnamed protein product [Timema poppensis]
MVSPRTSSQPPTHRDLSLSFLPPSCLLIMTSHQASTPTSFLLITTLEDLMWSKKCWNVSLQLGKLPQSVELSRKLTNLRAILGFQYCQLITTKRTTSSDKCLFELLIRMSPRVVWIALGRRSLYIIEAEMNRLFRSEAFRPSLFFVLVVSFAVVSSHGVVLTMGIGPGLVLVALACPPPVIAVPACAVISENNAACLSGMTLKPA